VIPLSPGGRLRESVVDYFNTEQGYCSITGEGNCCQCVRVIYITGRGVGFPRMSKGARCSKMGTLRGQLLIVLLLLYVLTGESNPSECVWRYSELCYDC